MIRPYNKGDIFFDLIKEIGPVGQNSRTYIAHDHQLNAEVVVKEILKQRLDSPDNFFDESKALYASAHPNNTVRKIGVSAVLLEDMERIRY